MLLGLHWLVWLHLLASLGAFALAVYVWRLPERPSRTHWVATLAFMGVSTGSYGLALLAFDPTLRAALELLTLAGILWTGIAFFGFALAYTGREHYVTGWPYRLLVVAGVVVTAVGLGNPVHHLLWRSFEVAPLAGMAGARYTIRPLLFGIAAGVYLIVGLGSTFLVELAANYTSTTVRRAVIFGLVPFSPLLAGLAWLFRIGPYPELNLIALALFPHIVVDVYALYYRDLLQIPAGLQRTGRQAAIEDLATPVVTLSADERIVDLNAAAETLFEIDTEAVHGDPVADLLGTDVDLPAGEQRIELAVDGERCIYNLSASPFESEGGSHRGYTLSIQDVTDEIQTKQRLDVLNRILRHNLRNDLNVVQLHAQELERSLSDPEHRHHAAIIDDISGELVDLGEKARWAAHTLDDVSYHSVGLRTLLDDVVGEVRSRHPDARVALEMPENVTLHTDPEVLTLVFTSVLENAVEHNDEGQPRVGVTVDADPDSLRIRVEDDGPGIPEHERRVIEDGGETALDHGSGVGLWLIHWGVTLLGGEVTFDVSQSGTTVSIRLPTANDAELD